MRRFVPSTALAVASIVALAVAAAAVAAFTSTVSVNPSPVAACAAPAAGGTVFNNSEVEPFVAANPSPTKAGNLIAVWQQDRWSNGGAHALMAAASFDGGMTWGSQTALPFNMCAPGGLSYERASDPWARSGPTASRTRSASRSTPRTTTTPSQRCGRRTAGPRGIT